MRIQEVLQEYNISANVLKNAFPEDSPLIDALIATEAPSVEAQDVEFKLVDKYLDNPAQVIEAKNKLKETYTPSSVTETQAVHVEEPVIEAVGAEGEITQMDFNIDLNAIESGETMPMIDLNVIEAAPVIEKETESLLYENFHVDTFQKMADLLALGEKKRPEYSEALYELQQNNLVKDYKFTDIGKKVYGLYKNGFVLGTHPFNYVMSSDKDIFPDINFGDKIIDTTYGVLFGVPFLASDDLYIKAPEGFNELKNAYYNYIKQMGNYLLNSNLVDAKLHCYEIKEIFDNYLGNIVFQVGDDYVAIDSLKYNYITNKFGAELFYQGVVSHTDKKATIVMKKGEEIVAIMTTEHFWNSTGHEIKVNHIEQSVEFTDKLKLEFSAITLPTTYKEFLRRDKTPIVKFNIEECRQEILEARRIQGDILDESLKTEYSVLVDDLKVLSELKFGMGATDKSVTELARGGEITIGDSKKHDTVYGYNHLGELVKCKIIDMKKQGHSKWISAKAEGGELISGDINTFKING